MDVKKLNFEILTLEYFNQKQISTAKLLVSLLSIHLDHN